MLSKNFSSFCEIFWTFKTKNTIEWAPFFLLKQMDVLCFSFFSQNVKNKNSCLHHLRFFWGIQVGRHVAWKLFCRQTAAGEPGQLQAAFQPASHTPSFSFFFFFWFAVTVLIRVDKGGKCIFKWHFAQSS